MHSTVGRKWRVTYERMQWRRNELTNLKVGGTGPARKWGHRSGAQIFFGRASPLFLALKAQLVVLVSAFVMVSTLWSFSCWLFF